MSLFAATMQTRGTLHADIHIRVDSDLLQRIFVKPSYLSTTGYLTPFLSQALDGVTTLGNQGFHQAQRRQFWHSINKEEERAREAKQSRKAQHPASEPGSRPGAWTTKPRWPTRCSISGASKKGTRSEGLSSACRRLRTMSSPRPEQGPSGLRRGLQGDCLRAQANTPTLGKYKEPETKHPAYRDFTALRIAREDTAESVKAAERLPSS